MTDRARSDALDLWMGTQDDQPGLVIEMSLSMYGVSLIHFLSADAAMELAQTIMAEVWRMEGEGGI